MNEFDEEDIRQVDTSVRSVIPMQELGSLIICGLPGLCISRDGSSYLDPEHAELTFSYLDRTGTKLIYLLMKNFELPPETAPTLQRLAKHHDITVQWLPIVDCGTPSQAIEDQWETQRAQRLATLNNHGAIALSCIYGAGRSGMMAAAIFAETGTDPRRAVHGVRRHFPDAVGNKKQEIWVAKRPRQSDL